MPITNFKTTNFTGHTFYVGLDTHKTSLTVTVRGLGLELAHFTQPSDVRKLSRHLKTRYPGAEFHSAYEAGFCGTTIHHALCKLGIKNIIIHPADLPKTDKQKKNKTDLHDSRALARYLEAGLLRPIYIMPYEQLQLRSLFRFRQAKVKDLTRCTNRLRSFLYFFGIELPEEFKEKKYLSNRFLYWLSNLKTLNEQGKQTLDHHIEDLIYHRKQVLQSTKELRKAVLSVHQLSYTCLLTVPGIGPIIAMALLAEIGDLTRFNDPDQYASYLGLIPAEQQSGETVYSVKLQPRCNTHLRPLLIEAAWVAIRKCPVLLGYYKKHYSKNNKKAILKVARKLALIAKSVAINHTAYEATW